MKYSGGRVRLFSMVLTVKRARIFFQSLPNLNTHLTLFNVSVEALDESVGVVDGVDDDVGVPGGRGARV